MPPRAIALGLGSLLISCSNAGHNAGGKLAEVERHGEPMGLEAARQYVLELVNRARDEQGLTPVQRDEAAERAAQRHTEDMVLHGFTAHWGTDGSVPEQRYTEAGGADFVQENAACFFDGQPRTLDPDPKFLPDQLERIQSAFLNEVPPNDGHRKNILKPVHNKLGVGLAKPTGVAQPCMSQEFVDAYAETDTLPRTAKPGQTIRVTGSVRPPAAFGGVGLSRLPVAAPRPASDLNETGAYAVPEPYVLYFPAGYKTPKPVQVDGTKFSIEVPLGKEGEPGRYGVSVWGRFPGSESLVMISLRTVDVR